MTANQEFVTNCEVAWSYMLPSYQIPHIKILMSWRRWYTADQVISGITDAAEYVSRQENLDSDAVGRIVSSMIRRNQTRYLAASGNGYTPPFPERT